MGALPYRVNGVASGPPDNPRDLQDLFQVLVQVLACGDSRLTGLPCLAKLLSASPAIFTQEPSMSPPPRKPRDTRLRDRLFLATVIAAVLVGLWLAR
jgi:hypothetical protein